MSNQISQKKYPDPRGMDPWEYQAQIAGYKNGEEFKKEYFKQAGKAVGAGVATGTGVFVGAFGVAAGGIAGAGELPVVVSFALRVGAKAVQVAKNVGVAAWNAAKSAWYSAVGTTATPQGQEVVKNTVECVGNLVDGTSPSATKVGSQCFMTKTTIETAKKIEKLLE